MRLTFVSLVPMMVGAVAFGAWDAYVATQRAAAKRLRPPPAHVRSHSDGISCRPADEGVPTPTRRRGDPSEVERQLDFR